VLIALYRNHFYAHRLQPARAVARRAWWWGLRRWACPSVWRDVPAQALPGARHDAGTRFYLFALKGLAYLSLRLGDQAKRVTRWPCCARWTRNDRVGGALIEAVRQRAEARDQPALMPMLDTDDDPDALHTGAAGLGQPGARARPCAAGALPLTPADIR
jgi:hypothetical protein